MKENGDEMSESVNLPALGESVTEGTVTRWLKQVGDRVEIDEPLLEVSTDKVDTEIPSPFAGILEEILVPEDETAEVGATLARIGTGAAAPAAAPAAEPAAPVAAGRCRGPGCPCRRARPPQLRLPPPLRQATPTNWCSPPWARASPKAQSPAG